MEHCSLLHVEDDDAMAYLFRAALDLADVSVSVYRVCDGHQALAFLRKTGAYATARTPRLVVLDGKLPGVDGWEVLEAWGHDDPAHSVPIVFFTTANSRHDRERALALGARQFITKPFQFEDLLKEVKFLSREYLS